MTIGSISSTINASFIQKLGQGRAPSGSASDLLSTPNAIKVTLSGLKQGVPLISQSIQKLNSAASYLHLTDEKLRDLSTITDEMLKVSEEAARNGIGSSRRNQLNAVYRSLVEKFQDVLTDKNSTSSLDPLNQDDLEKVFSSLGLDPKKSAEYAKILKEFDGIPNSQGEESLASDLQSASHRGTIQSLFEADRGISTKKEAKKVVEELKGLKEQLGENLKATGDGQKFLMNNLFMLRSTGLAFIEVQKDFSAKAPTTVEQIVSSVQEKLRGMSREQLSQIQNLDPLVSKVLLGS